MNKSLLFLSTLCMSAWAHTSASDVCKLVQAPRDSFVVQLPFEVVDGRIYVQARVNDHGPFRFAIDTGASGLGRADATLVAALGLKPQGKSETSDGVQSAKVDTVRLDSLDLGGLARKDLEVITRNYGGSKGPAAFHGIVGREFFADGLLILDYPNRTLSFSRSLSLPAAGEQILKYERAFRVPVSIGQVRTEGNLDTGANVSFVLPQALYDKIGSAPLHQAGQGTLTNTKVDTKRAVVGGPFRIGAAEVKDVDVRVSERFPELLVGAHVLQRYAVMIDQRARSVALCP
ncbi:pepsin/retropepsin-like aspartic protease family protein [Massilia sp. ST3]|uniref:pepsin/retropepsin-like aspartic protease family protein n=1 Tax=Massilia sp. ST3 TaxID=2824903 RepID=UPI001B81A8DD|nr:pepsin/retropepsin-like aspartic protease family protein [Massilia sp. ST3]MBQ5949737.1 aspartyl protease family protein [Massilia sp. ST3]